MCGEDIQACKTRERRRKCFHSSNIYLAFKKILVFVTLIINIVVVTQNGLAIPQYEYNVLINNIPVDRLAQNQFREKVFPERSHGFNKPQFNVDGFSNYGKKNNYENSVSDLNIVENNSHISYFCSKSEIITTWNEIIEKAGIQPIIKENSKINIPADSKIRVVDEKIKFVIGFDSTFNVSENWLERILLSSNAKVVTTMEKINNIVITVPITSLESFFTQWNTLKQVRYIEPSLIYSIDFIPDDPNWSVQWGPQKILADVAWDVQVGNSSIVLIAVIDTGIDYTHPDLSSQYVPLGYDWVNDDTDPMDDQSHGTHCAGTIAATINNSIGIAGVAQVQIMAEKIFNAYGEGSDYAAANAIIHAVDQGADILSNSWGGSTSSSILKDAISYAATNNVIIVAAAGNDGTPDPHYPSNYPEVISVSATNINDNLASFSNYGSTIELSAPGVDIYSTLPPNMGSYGNRSGTSMACPHVSGVAALILSEFPDWSAERVRMHLWDTADDLGEPGWDKYYGYGRLNAYNAVQPPPNHEIRVSLEVPMFQPLSESIEINTTVYNRGIKDETDVLLQLWINNTLVDSQTYTSLLAGTSENFNYLWTPIVEGIYNITTYVHPVNGEEKTKNNNVTKYVPVTIITQITDFEDSLVGWYTDGLWHLVNNSQMYTETHSPTHAMYYGQDDSGNYDTRTTNTGVLMTPKYLLNSDVAALNFWSWYETEEQGHNWDLKDVYIVLPNDTWIQLGYVRGEMLVWTYYSFGIRAFNGLIVRFAFVFDTIDDTANRYRGWYIDDITIAGHANQQNWHDLRVTLETPKYQSLSKTSILNTTVTNLGTYNETNIELQLWFNNTLIITQLYPSLITGETKTLTYQWAPTVAETVNVTAYAAPVNEETNLVNNNETIISYVFDPSIGDVAILNADGSEHPRYWIGGWNNDYESLYNGLTANGIATLLVTNYDILSGALTNVRVLIMVDNAPNESATIAVKDWYIAGGSILTFDSSICFLNWAGVLPPEAAGNNGCFLYWDYGSPSEGVVVDNTHPIMAGYDYNQTIYGSPNDSQYYCSVMQETSSGLSYTPLVKTSIESNYDLVVVYEPTNSGNVVQIWDQNHWKTTSNQLLIKNAISWFMTKQVTEHDLAVTLKGPVTHLVNDTIILNATIHNVGLNNENNVELQLWFNNSLMTSESYASLFSGTTKTLSYYWTPTVEGMYNVTAYVVPVIGETYTFNNIRTNLITVDEPTITFELENYIQLNSKGALWANFTYVYFIDSTHIYMDVGTRDWLSVNIITRLVDDGSTWLGSYYIGQIETDIEIGDTIDWLNTKGNVVGTVWYNWNEMLLEAWNISIDSNKAFAYYHKETGIWLYHYQEGTEIYMVDTNFILPEHELKVSLEVPTSMSLNKTTIINATVYNRGLNNETNIEVQLWLDNTLVASKIYSLLLTGTADTFSYLWTPTILGRHNITVYAVPLINEASVINNIATEILFVVYPKDITSPLLTSPANIIYEEGSIGNKISWVATDLHSNSYTIIKDGTEIDNGSWVSGIPINMSIDGLEIGSYNYTLVVEDLSGNWAANTVLVIVVDTTFPTLTNPADIIYEEGSIGNKISWVATDLHSNSYTIIKDGTEIDNGSWVSGIPINMSIDGLEIGSYNYTLVVEDLSGNWAANTVLVTVVESTFPTLTNPTDIIYEGTTVFTSDTSTTIDPTTITSIRGTIVMVTILFSLISQVIRKRRK